MKYAKPRNAKRDLESADAITSPVKKQFHKSLDSLYLVKSIFLDGEQSTFHN